MFQQLGCGHSITRPNVATKRSFVDDGKMDVDDVVHDTKRCKKEEDVSDADCLPESEQPKSDNQLLTPDPRTVIAKVYDSPDDINLNDVVEVIGVLSFDTSRDETSLSATNKSAVGPKESTLPHIHVPILLKTFFVVADGGAE
jgi:hypothetical protein